MCFIELSWDEIGKYDVPATINYVLGKTGKSKLSYIGYSLGSTTYFISMIARPEMNSKVDIMVCFVFSLSFLLINLLYSLNSFLKLDNFTANNR